jgi:hypothetical protein
MVPTEDSTEASEIHYPPQETAARPERIHRRLLADITHFFGLHHLARVATSGSGVLRAGRFPQLVAPDTPEAEAQLGIQRRLGRAGKVAGLPPEWFEEPGPEDVATVAVDAALIMMGGPVLRGLGSVLKTPFRLIKTGLSRAFQRISQASAPAIRRIITGPGKGAADELVEEAVELTARPLREVLQPEVKPAAEMMTQAEFDDIIAATFEAIDNNEALKKKFIDNTADRIFLRIGEALELQQVTPRILPRRVAEVASRHGLNSRETAQLTRHVFEEAVSLKGSGMKMLSDVQKAIGARLGIGEAGAASFWARLGYAAFRPTLRGGIGAGIGAVVSEPGERLKGAAVGGALGALAFGPRGIRTWRAIITSQPATSARNFLVGGGTTAMRVYTDIVENSIGAFARVATAGSGGKPLNLAFRDGFEQLSALWRRMPGADRKRVEQLLDRVPKTREYLFGAPIADVTLDNFAYKFLHTLNRTQEYFWRRTRFDAAVHQSLRRIGVDPVQLARQGLRGMSPERVKSIERVFTSSATDALEITFAAPKASSLLTWMNKIPQTFLAFPFPRFVANSLDFMYKHSPLGLARFFSPATRAAIQSGELPASRILAQASASIPLLGMGVGIRMSDRAGEKWYEVKVGDRVFDARPFNPLAAYLFMGEYIKQVSDRVDSGLSLPDAIAEASLRDTSPREWGEAFLGIRGIERTGLVVLDVMKMDNLRSFQGSVQGFAEQFLAGYMIPFGAVRDVLALDPTFRDAEDAGIFGRALGQVPGVGTPMPSATRTTPVGQEPPLDIFGVEVTPGQVRQATGFTLRTKTEVERELDRLKVKSIVFPGTGDDVVDRLITERTGPMVEHIVGQLVTSPGYQGMSDHDKKEVLRSVVGRIKEAVKPVVFAEESSRIRSELVRQLSRVSLSEARDDLRRMRNAGRINPAIEAMVLGDLVRRSKQRPNQRR